MRVANKVFVDRVGGGASAPHSAKCRHGKYILRAKDWHEPLALCARCGVSSGTAILCPDDAREGDSCCKACYKRHALRACLRLERSCPGAAILVPCAACGAAYHISSESSFLRVTTPCWARNNSGETICASCERRLCRKQARITAKNARYFSAMQRRVMFTLLLIRNRIRSTAPVPHGLGGLDASLWYRIFIYSLPLP